MTVRTQDTALVSAAAKRFIAAATRLPTLYDLEDWAYQLLALLENADDSRGSLREAGFVAEDIEAELSSQLALIDQMMAEKTESYVSVIRSLESMAIARKAEADRLKARAATAERHADWLKNRLLVHLQTTGQSRIETSRFTLAIRTNPPACVVIDAAAVPSDYQRTEIEISVDRRAILEDFKKSGVIPPGVEISRGERLAIS